VRAIGSRGDQSLRSASRPSVQVPLPNGCSKTGGLPAEFADCNFPGP